MLESKKNISKTNKSLRTKQINEIPSTKKNNVNLQKQIKLTTTKKVKPNTNTSQKVYIKKSSLGNKQITKTNNQTTKRYIKKRKIKVKNIIIFILLLTLIILIPIYFLILKPDSNEKKPNTNNQNNDTPPIDESEELDEFDYLKQSLSFYKEEYKNRYITYKEKNPNLDLETVIVHVNIGLDQDFYTNILESPRQQTDLIIVNKYNALNSNYVPQNLETINSKYSSGTKQLESSARIAFEQLAKDAQLEGYTIRAISTYRSYSYQKTLYTRYANADGKELADTYSARPGHSEHQTGLAVDVDNKILSYTDFGNTKEFTWMKENAYKYGFILRYTKDNEFITGYKDEPWHYRYVGVEVATYIQNNPMSYEEYYVRFLQ